jgi:hypothetical protein
MAPKSKIFSSSIEILKGKSKAYASDSAHLIYGTVCSADNSTFAS